MDLDFFANTQHIPGGFQGLLRLIGLPLFLKAAETVSGFSG
jgi:hypothetical protein